MAAPYNDEFDKFVNGYNNFNNGVFFDGKYNSIRVIDPNLTGHDSDYLFGVFKGWFLPGNTFGLYTREEALEFLQDRICAYKRAFELDRVTLNKFMAYKLYQYFYQVYSSSNTKFDEWEVESIDLFDTTGYPPNYYMAPNPRNYNKLERQMVQSDLLNILKSVYVQACDIDSLEIVPAKYHSDNLQKVILTSKFNPYETFYNYLLMDWEVQVIPKKIYNTETEKFEDHSLSEFFIPDSELRLKDEIESIKRLVKLDDRREFFR